MSLSKDSICLGFRCLVNDISSKLLPKEEMNHDSKLVKDVDNEKEQKDAGYKLVVRAYGKVCPVCMRRHIQARSQ